MDFFLVYLVMQVFAESGTTKVLLGVSNNSVLTKAVPLQLIYNKQYCLSQPNATEFRTKKENKCSSTLNETGS